MCQIIYVPKGKEVNIQNLDQAQTKNSDGYGVMWFEEGEVKVFKTMKFKRFKQIIEDLTEFEKVLHLRNTTRGATNLANAHPFNVGYGYMMHNGTVSSLYAKDGKSDSQQLAKMINDAGIYDFAGSEELLKQIIGDKINRLVFMDLEGDVTIINEDLGKWEEGIWYSNEYHVCPVAPANKGTYGTYHQPANKALPHKDSTGSEHNLTATVLLHKDDDGSVTTAYEMADEKWYTITLDKDGNEQSAVSHITYNGAKVYHDKCVEARKEFASQDSTKPTSETEYFKVFVYGTLKRGQGNHHLLKDSQFLGKAHTKFKWAMINNSNGSFPYLLQTLRHGEHVQGEVFKVNRATLARLDTLEGTPTHYRRAKLDVNYNDGGSEKGVITYVKVHITQEDLQQPKLKEWVSGLKALADK